MKAFVHKHLLSLFRQNRDGQLPWYLHVPFSVASGFWIRGSYVVARAQWRRRRVRERRVGSESPSDGVPLKSILCTQEQHDSRAFREWAARFGEPHEMRRKQWEFCYIAQVLHERGLLRPGVRGLGFAVGEEPLSAVFASFGCEVVARDMDAERAAEAGWSNSHEHAHSIEMLNVKGLCPADEFAKLVSFRVVDMNAIPDDLRGFDFLWSACALEHLGSIRKGEEFIYNAMDCLKPGGIAVHTTEYNVSSNSQTPDNAPTVCFRTVDVERIAKTLTTSGHRIELDLTEPVSARIVCVTCGDLSPGPSNLLHSLFFEWQNNATSVMQLALF